jgi:AraC family transcriptional regulator
MATTLAVHLLRHYSLRQPLIQQFAGGLPKYKLQQILDYINEHLAEDLSLEVMAALVDMSLHYFCRLFKQSTGMSPHKYLTQQRIERAKQLLKLQNAAIADIAIQCGFANQGHFTKSFRQLTGMTPKVYRNVV